MNNFELPPEFIIKLIYLPSANYCFCNMIYLNASYTSELDCANKDNGRHRLTSNAPSMSYTTAMFYKTLCGHLGPCITFPGRVLHTDANAIVLHLYVHGDEHYL